MKIVFFNRFFHPDGSATSQLLSDLAFGLAAQGREVHVVASHGAAQLAGRETVRGVEVHRVAAGDSGAHGLTARSMAHARYYLAARRAARRLLGRGDIAVVNTDPPLLSCAIVPGAKARGANVVAWLHDLFPEVAQEYGIPGMAGPIGTSLRRMRDRSLAACDAVVPICEGMAARVQALGCVGGERLRVIHNWADGGSVMPIEAADNALRRQWGFAERFVVGYSGNLGRTHEFDTLLDAAALLRAREDIAFVVVGRGPRLAEVRERVARDNLANIRIEPPQERTRLAETLAVADVHVSVLRPAFDGLVHPSKLYGIMAAGRPTLFVGSAVADTTRILAQSAAGARVANGDAEALAAAILGLHAARSERRAMGERARAAFEARYDMPRALAHWSELLDSGAISRTIS